MNEIKVLIRPERLRFVPDRFSWCDQGLFRSDLTAHCSLEALVLYLFLLTVADSQGLSYYSQASMCRRLRLQPEQVVLARQQLLQADLIAYQAPLYQVLSLPQPGDPPPSQRLGRAASVGEILHRALQQPGGVQ
jgi:hypothetical protein